jgi:hypothetical protein
MRSRTGPLLGNMKENVAGRRVDEEYLKDIALWRMIGAT